MPSAIDFVPESGIDFQPDDLSGVKLSPYEQARMQGQGAGLGATSGPASPEEVIPSYLALAEPALRLPRLRPKSGLGQVLAAPVNVAASLAEGVTSPLGLATLPLFETRLGRLAMGAAGAGQGGLDVYRGLRSGNPGQTAEGALMAGLGAALTLPARKPPVQGPPAAGTVLERRTGAIVAAWRTRQNLQP